MTAFLLPALLLAALHVLWFLAFLADARRDRHADPIGRVLNTWLQDSRAPRANPAASASWPPQRPPLGATKEMS